MDKHTLYVLLRKERIPEFNKAVEGQEGFDLKNINLRGRNLTGVNFKYADLRGAYLANCTLKGVNFSHSNLEGASMHRARISGVYFPKNVSADEILNTVNYGTRIRTTGNEIHEDDTFFGEEL